MTEPVQNLLGRLKGVRKRGAGYEARCPAHDDQHASLSISPGDDGRALVHCHAGCSFPAVMAALGLTAVDAFAGPSPTDVRPPKRSPSRNGRVFPGESAVLEHLARSLRGRQSGLWAYQREDGDEAFRIVRFDGCNGTRPKQYRPLHRAGDDWHIADPPGPLPLYGLPDLRDAEMVWVCEGEKCAEILRDLGLIATTNAHGAQAVDKSDWAPLAGKLVVVCPDNDAAGEAHARAIEVQLGRLTPEPSVRVVRLPLKNEGDDVEQFVQTRRAAGASDDEIRRELEQLAAAAEVVEPPRELDVVRLSDVTMSEQTYLWPGRIPSSACTLVGGPQGQTKNLFAYDLMARVTTGSPWPGEHDCARRTPHNVILLEAEEHLESSIAPRVQAAGADLARVRFIRGAPTCNPDRTRLVSIQRDMDAIERCARQIGNVALVVVSPITSYLGDVEQNSNEQVRNEIIYPLKMMAEALGCAIVILKHPNKDWKNPDPLTRIGGSAAWTEAMRCIVFIGADPDEPDDEKNPRRAAHWIKFSIGLTPDPLSWKVHVADNGAPAIHYLDDPVTFSAPEMLVGRRKHEQRKSKREIAAEWITETLQMGPMTAAALKDAALRAEERDRKFSINAYELARKDLRDAGRLTLERKPETSPAEWWYWLTNGAAPDWYVVVGEGTEATSADASRARVDPPTCGTCGS